MSDNHETEARKDHKRIYLEPDSDESDARMNGRLWCCDQIDDDWTEYVRSDLLDEALRQRDEAVAALEPFAEIGFEMNMGDNLSIADHTPITCAAKTFLSAGDFRRASEIIARAR